MVKWKFLFQALDAIEFSNEFSLMMLLLFNDTKICMKINRTFLEPFMIERRVQQGCPLVLHIFLIIAKVFNIMTIKKTKIRDTRGIQLSIVHRQQIMA